MFIHKLAGKKVIPEMLPNIPRLISQYYRNFPNLESKSNLVAFGTSGHRGKAETSSFNESHVLAISQAICDYRRENQITGPLFVGMDTHALSEPAHITAIEVFAGNQVQTIIHKGFEYTPTPVISHAILTYNKVNKDNLSDGVIITPSHNPPTDGGFKYNPTTGGPAGSEITNIIQNRANEILFNNLKDVKRMVFNKALNSDYIHEQDFLMPYVNDLENIINMEAISQSNLKIGVDPLGGSGIHYWQPIAEKYSLNLTVVNKNVDPTFSFMCVDRDGKIRMDCSSPYAMAGLIKLKDDFDIAFGNDPDFDRHGIVTGNHGLINPNHYLAVAIQYLFNSRNKWNINAKVGKTLVSSSMIDRVVKKIGRNLSEVPVGFKWFVNGLLDGSFGFGGEESAGASFLRKNGEVWTTDKDGIILNLLAAEITAVTGENPGDHYKKLENEFGSPIYARIDAPASLDEKNILKKLSPEMVKADSLANEKIIQKLTNAPGNNAPIGGLKVVTENGWFAARPSGTENIYKIYAESFLGKNHLEKIQIEAQEIVSSALGK